MGPRLRDREILSDTLSKVAQVLPHSSAADVLVLKERCRVSGEARARGDDLERLEMRATEIERIESERNDLQAHYAALKAEHARLQERNKALGVGLAALRNF